MVTLQHLRESALELLKSDDWERRYAAVLALGDCGGEDDKAKLTDALLDKVPAVRAEAVRSLQKLGASEALESIRALFNGGNSDGAGHTQDLAGAIIKRFDSYGDEFVSEACAQAIAQLTSIAQQQQDERKVGNW